MFNVGDVVFNKELNQLAFVQRPIQEGHIVVLTQDDTVRTWCCEDIEPMEALPTSEVEKMKNEILSLRKRVLDLSKKVDSLYVIFRDMADDEMGGILSYLEITQKALTSFYQYRASAND